VRARRQFSTNPALLLIVIFSRLQSEPIHRSSTLNDSEQTVSVCHQPVCSGAAVNAAKQMLDDEDKMMVVHETIRQGEEEAREKLREKRKLAKRKREEIPEDKYEEDMKKFVRKVTVMLFADYEKRRVELEGQGAKVKYVLHCPFRICFACWPLRNLMTIG
jgi:hypothetical protein